MVEMYVYMIVAMYRCIFHILSERVGNIIKTQMIGNKRLFLTE